MDDYLLRMSSPIGRLELRSDGLALTALAIERDGALPGDGLPERPTAVLEQAARELDEYFAGRRTEFEVPVVRRGTPFQQAVWQAIDEAPFGATLSYGEIARRIGSPTASRAVGAAVGANPVPIVTACHRVLAADGRITGFSGGAGIVTKSWLLAHESIGFPV